MTACRARHNILALKFFSFIDALYPMSILAVVWFYQVTGSYTTAAMMFAIQTISQALLEIPTGVLSDKYSRILNLRLSAFLWFISYFFTALSGSVSSYRTVILIFASVIGGLAGSLNSGTKEALIYETLSDCRKQSKFSVVFSRIMFWEQIGAIFGALIAVGTMFLFDIKVLAWTTVLFGFLFFISSFFLYEPITRQKSDKSSFGLLLSSCKQIWKDKKLRTLIGINMLQGQTAYNMEGVYFSSLIPSSLIPLARLFRQFTGATGFYMAAFANKIGFLKTLIFSNAGSFVFNSVGLLLNGIATPFINSATNLFYGFNHTAYNALLQENFSDKQRATMQNIQSLLSSISGCVLLLIFGTIADHFSLLTAMWCTTALNFIVTIAYYRFFRSKLSQKL